MKFKIVIENDARADMRNASLWYNKQKRGLGKDFILSVRKSIKQIHSFPKSTQIRYFDVHTAVMKTFPFMIHYYINEELKSIIIIAILHTSRNPEIWENR